MLFDAGLDVIEGVTATNSKPQRLIKITALLSPMGRKSIKDYDEKLLVVVNPWPPSGPTHRQFVNNVASWFEVMLGKSNGIKVDAVYQQRTHHHIIVELPAEANIDRLIGAHHWGQFLVEPWGSRHQEKVSYIYEYKYQVFRHPSQINWHAAIPTYSAIDPAFPIRSPYPPPRPAPSTSLPYAAALPPQLRLVNNPPPHEQSETINHEIPSDQEPTHARTKLSKKDPYEQEEDAMRSLQAFTPPKIHTNEEKPSIEADNYEPSSELVSLLAQYQAHDTKLPKIEFKQEEIYHPSIELKAAITDHITRVKREDGIDNENDSLKRRNADDDRPTKRVKKECS